MAPAPDYLKTPYIQAGVVSATAYSGTLALPTGLTKICDGPTTANVTLAIRRIDFKWLGNAADGLIALWLATGAGPTYSLIPIPSGQGQNRISLTANSTTQDPFQMSFFWPEGVKGLYLPGAAGSASWNIYAGASTTQGTGGIQSTVHGTMS